MSTIDWAANQSAMAAALFDGLADPMLLCDRLLRIVAANQAASELLGVHPGSILGRKADEVLVRSQSGGIRTTPADPTVLEWRCEIEDAGKRRRLLEISGSVLKEPGSGARGWALTLREIGQLQDPPHFVARSVAAQELLEFVSRIAASRAASILLSGESGTGKELIAKRLHCLSSRAAAPFVPINCAALPESLLESELFGYEKGAFTGAAETRLGLLETASGGTLFLDEIGELSLPLQAKLLRVLEDHTIRRVGGSENIFVDLRVIGATNVDLERAIEERRFRSDLFYRLNVVQIRLPALRERPEDIQELAMHFLSYFNRLHHRRIRGIHPAAQRVMDLHPWPGNVRELRNVMERAVLVEPSPLITAPSLAIPSRALAPRPPAPEPRQPSQHLSLRSSEQELITAALAEAGGNQTRAADLLGIGRFSLRYRMKKFGMLK